MVAHRQLARGIPAGGPNAARSSRDNILTWTIVAWAALSLLAGSISFGEGLYLSQPLHLAIIGVLVMARLGERHPLQMPAGAFVVLVAITLPLISDSTGNDRFIAEQLKVLMLIAGASALAMYMRWELLLLLARILPSLLCAIVAVTWMTGEWDYYGGGRFGVPLLGSPNTTAFVIIINLALTFHIIDLRGKLRVYEGAILLLLGYTLLRTESDGGLTSLFFLVGRYLRVPMSALVLGGFLAVILATLLIYLFSIELPDLFGSGRLVIWSTLLYNLFNSGWVSLIFGFGPGAIDLEPGFTAVVRSAHSMFLEIAYSYGLIGLAAMIFVIARTGLKLGAARLDAKERRVLEGLYVAFLSGAFVDAYFVTAQLVWLGSLVLAIFALIDQGKGGGSAIR